MKVKCTCPSVYEKQRSKNWILAEEITVENDEKHPPPQKRKIKEKNY
jgi:hypothetical protein